MRNRDPLRPLRPHDALLTVARTTRSLLLRVAGTQSGVEQDHVAHAEAARRLASAKVVCAVRAGALRGLEARAASAEKASAEKLRLLQAMID